MTRCLIHPLMIAGSVAILMASGVCQEPSVKSTSEARGSRSVVSRAPADMLAQVDQSLQQLASKVSPAIVQIETTRFGPSEETGRKETAALLVRQRVVGSGVIVDPDGYIMTNAHVVESAQRIRVVLSLAPPTFGDVPGSGKVQVLDAKVIGLQKEADLALLKVEASNLPTLRFRERPPQLGELVFAIGSPEGLQNSVSMGVISSAWRQPDPDSPMVYLQTDAPMNPGNSGGPLIDLNGEVVGLNTFILTNGGGSQGLGFAIPARIVDFVYQGLRKYGHVHRVEIGAVAQTITPTMAEALGLTQNWGVIIADVTPDGPAEKAGIRAEDVISAVDGNPVLGLTGFTAALCLHPPDQALTIDVLRGDQKLSFRLDALLARDRMDQLADVADPVKSRVERLGIWGLDLNDELRPLLSNVRMDTGVIVAGQAAGFNSVDSGLRPGDVIHAFNRTPIESVDQLQSAVSKLKAGDAVVLRIERLGQFQYLAFEMD